MASYRDCPVCQNINGAGVGDCPGHDDDVPESDHDCLLPDVCGMSDPFSDMAGMAGPGHTILCRNAHDPEADERYMLALDSLAMATSSAVCARIVFGRDSDLYAEALTVVRRRALAMVSARKLAQPAR